MSIYNIFTTNLKRQVVIGFQLGSPLTSFFLSINKSLSPKICNEIVVNVKFLTNYLGLLNIVI